MTRIVSVKLLVGAEIAVMPAQAGIQENLVIAFSSISWTPACAGMTPLLSIPQIELDRLLLFLFLILASRHGLFFILRRHFGFNLDWSDSLFFGYTNLFSRRFRQIDVAAFDIGTAIVDL